MSKTIGLSFDIEAVHCFTSGNIADYQLCHLNKMKARRLSALGKVAIDTSLKLYQKSDSIDFIIYASRHGELDFSYEIIKGIGEKKAVSPMKFSHSVHNSCAGFLANLQQINTPISAISAMEDSFEMGLLSALNFLKSNSKSTVLYLFADARTPSIYANKIDAPNEDIVIAMLVKDGHTYTFKNEERNEISQDCPQRFAKWLTSDEPSKPPLKMNHWILEHA